MSAASEANQILKVNMLRCEDKQYETHREGSENTYGLLSLSVHFYCMLSFLGRTYTRSAEHPGVLCMKVIDAVGFLRPPDISPLLQSSSSHSVATACPRCLSTQSSISSKAA